MAKKEDFQKDFTKLLVETKDRFRKFGKELSVFAKKSEKEIVKASKAGKIQLDIIRLNMQKEKLYYEIGKKVVSLKTKKNLAIPELESSWSKLRKLQANARKKKRELSGVTKKNK